MLYVVEERFLRNTVSITDFPCGKNSVANVFVNFGFSFSRDPFYFSNGIHGIQWIFFFLFLIYYVGRDAISNHIVFHVLYQVLRERGNRIEIYNV